jgi:hypothetical protein
MVYSMVYNGIARRFGIWSNESMLRQRVMVPYPPEVIAEIDKLVSNGKRTAFLVDLAKREIKLNRQKEALRAAKGAWKSEDHPELADGAAKWIHDLRQESVKRYQKIERHREAE